MRKFFIYFIPIALLSFFILVMLSGNFLKGPIGSEKSIPKSIEAIIKDINSDKWEEANKKANELSKLWKKIVTRVQFSSERDEINAFSVNMARLRGSITIKDKAGSIKELNEAYEHWDELGN